ncbi:LuxR C-terminal-related transcriptional regulator [Epilithonimonas tenax]|uniref:LuxR C-terminal-related transcriptional regulator n=1 Tax=Epilithonimonas tenax TaxID=191577 RepID=UPI0003FA3BBA|nr:LuxR C-terminal-related transcriptional regulator [Epilithonimonas tenax]
MKENLQQIEKLHEVWSLSRSAQVISFDQMNYDDLVNSIISSGPFYYYIIDFFDLSVSNISPGIYDLHGLEPDKVSLDHILETIHPDDMEFVIKAEALITKFFYEVIGKSKILNYKMNYSFRSRSKNGDYKLLNHQALLLSLDENGNSAKSLNIHTQIDHLSQHNTYKISLIGLNGEPSFMNISLDDHGKNKVEFSRREIEIIRLISEGKSNEQVGRQLSISPLTVKKHRSNILDKADCSNTAQLIKNCMQQGVI